MALALALASLFFVCAMTKKNYKIQQQTLETMTLANRALVTSILNKSPSNNAGTNKTFASK